MTGLIPVHQEDERSVVEPDERFTAAATATRIDDRLHNPAYEMHDNGFRDDAALRAIIDLRDALRRADGERFSRLVHASPPSVGDRRWDAFVAAVVEDEGARKGCPVPRWTGEPWRFTKPFWYLSPVRAHHSSDFARTHGSLLRHGVVAAHEDLESV